MSERPFSQASATAIVAHRGASAGEAENTLPGFERAIAAGADVVEFDVRISADGVAVVIHDADVSRTTDGAGLVCDLRLEDLKALTIRMRDGAQTEVPTLDEVLRLCSGRIAVDVEIKNIPGELDFEHERERAVEATLTALDDTAFSGVVLISSFNPLSIARARELAPDVPTGLLTEYSVDARVAAGFAAEQGHAWVLPFVDRIREAGPALPGEVHALGLRVGTWIEDDPAGAVALARSGLDAIATNDPETIVPAMAAAGLR